jgi:hypothetical protein
VLKRSNRLSKNPEEYENENDRKRKIGLAIGARKGDVIEYYESDTKEGYSLNQQEISIRKYKEMLWKAVKEILEIAGYEIVSIEQELFSTTISHMVLEVWLNPKPFKGTGQERVSCVKPKLCSRLHGRCNRGLGGVLPTS